ncbi:MAG: nucleotidyl transferase AbiEii/AbiGii toxin family protein [Bacteroidales bacterium]|nr:nucleotidyl transferase AbiEii/AbiGii toxin family protein [Bacteroidales bacterium]
MLYTQTVEPGTLSLLKQLMDLPSLRQFSLVGGTALALRYGHRSSVDLDLFFDGNPDFSAIEIELRETFGNDFLLEGGIKKLGIFCYIKRIKVDIVHFPVPLIGPVTMEEGIRLYSNDDIAAMKVQAILGRARKKDFWDLHVLLQHYSLGQIIEWHQQKYPAQMLAISIPNAITYFVEADESETPVSFNGQTWTKVKKDISKAVREYLS